MNGAGGSCGTGPGDERPTRAKLLVQVKQLETDRRRLWIALDDLTEKLTAFCEAPEWVNANALLREIRP